MKAILVVIAIALFGLNTLRRLVLGPSPAATATLPVATRRAGPVLAGRVLAAPFQVLRAPAGGRLVRLYVSEGQPVKAGDLLLKLTRGAHRPASAAGRPMRPVFALAPVAGDVAGLRVAVGRYLAAGTPYARLTPRGAVRVRVAAAAADQLCPGDSVRVLTGPVGLVGAVTPLTALRPDPPTAAAATTVLVLGRLGWPLGTAVAVGLVPLHPRGAAVLAAN